MSDETGQRLRQAIARHQAGDLDGAEADYRLLLAYQPEHAETCNAYGILHLQRGDAALAAEQFRSAIASGPETGKYHSNLGSACLILRDAAGAVAAFEAAVDCEPENAEFLANLATARLSRGDETGAERDFRRALALAPAHVRALNNLGGLLSRNNRLGEAQALLQQCVGLPGAGDEAKLNLASVLERMNRLDEAEETLTTLSQAQAPAAILLRARLLRRRDQAAAALRLLDQVPQTEVAAQGSELAGDWQHETGLAADLCQDSRRAFVAFLAAKAAWRGDAQANNDGETYRRHVQRLRQGPAPGHAISEPALRLGFLVGFPRSGTTLLEVMLAAHPQVRTTAERALLPPLLDADGLPRDSDLAAAYRGAAAAIPGGWPEGGLLIDKLPLNLIYCRTIDAALPGARLLVALRDPRDVVLSCLMQRFRPNPAMASFDSLETTVALYEAVMGLWLEARSTLRLPVLEYRYEELIADWRGVLSRILDFYDLPWDDALDRYREQAGASAVITPSYRDVASAVSTRASGRWRRYRQELAPALPRLARFVEAFGYEH